MVQDGMRLAVGRTFVILIPFGGGKPSFCDLGVVMSFVSASFILPMTAQREMFVAWL